VMSFFFIQLCWHFYNHLCFSLFNSVQNFTCHILGNLLTTSINQALQSIHPSFRLRDLSKFHLPQKSIRAIRCLNREPSYAFWVALALSIWIKVKGLWVFWNFAALSERVN
jgi:hypothetical protein